MNLLRIFIFLIQFVQFINSAKTREPPPKFLIRPNYVNCESDNITISTKYCNLKPQSRYLVTVQIGFHFLVPLKKPFYIQILVFYRYGTIFRQIIDTKQNEWCSYMEGTGVNPLVRSITEFMNITFPENIHKCPYEGDLEFRNYTLSNGLPPQSEIFPQGYYRLHLIVHKNKKTILTFKIQGEITSVFKESFG